MLSGIGPKHHLHKMGIPVVADLPVGNNHQNHPFLVVDSTILDQTLFESPPELNISSLTQLYYHKSGPLTENAALGLYFNSGGNKIKN